MKAQILILIIVVMVFMGCTSTYQATNDYFDDGLYNTSVNQKQAKSSNAMRSDYRSTTVATETKPSEKSYAQEYVDYSKSNKNNSQSVVYQLDSITHDVYKDDSLGDVHVINNYYSEDYESRLKRFHGDEEYESYFDVEGDGETYDNVNVYVNSGWGYPYYSSWDYYWGYPYYGWSWNFGWGYPYYVSPYWGWGYNPYYAYGPYWGGGCWDCGHHGPGGGPHDNYGYYGRRYGRGSSDGIGRTRETAGGSGLGSGIENPSSRRTVASSGTAARPSSSSRGTTTGTASLRQSSTTPTGAYTRIKSDNTTANRYSPATITTNNTSSSRQSQGVASGNNPSSRMNHSGTSVNNNSGRSRYSSGNSNSSSSRYSSGSSSNSSQYNSGSSSSNSSSSYNRSNSGSSSRSSSYNSGSSSRSSSSGFSGGGSRSSGGSSSGGSRSSGGRH